MLGVFMALDLVLFYLFAFLNFLFIMVPLSVRFVYMLKGYYTEFYKYDPARDTWYALPDAPTGLKLKWDKGSWIVYDGRRSIFAHAARYYNRASDRHYLFKYDVLRDSWVQGSLTGMPLWGQHGRKIKRKKSKDGGCAACGAVAGCAPLPVSVISLSGVTRSRAS